MSGSTATVNPGVGGSSGARASGPASGAPVDRRPGERGPRPAAVLACRSLTKRFHTVAAVSGVGFDVHRGEAFGLVGPLGSGKTTTVRMVCGLLSPDEGTVAVQGRTLRALDGHETRTLVGYVPESATALPSLGVAENLSFWARLVGLAPERRSERIGELLDLVGLGHCNGHPVSDCNGGEQRRLGLAVALLLRPRLVVLDEPTAGLDTRCRDSLLRTLGQVRDAGVAVLITAGDGDADAGRALCDRVRTIHRGRLV